MKEYEYMIVTQSNEFTPSVLPKMDDNAIAGGVSSDIKDLVKKCDADLDNGWEIISHSVQFFENRLVTSLLLRRPVLNKQLKPDS